jgi:C4-dicarboxylate-specific signal transduction histidine kinase
VDVTIKDNGIGIRPEVLIHLFEPFVQDDQGIDRAQGGIGLGLALAKSIADLHGGSIRATMALAGAVNLQYGYQSRALRRRRSIPILQ